MKRVTIKPMIIPSKRRIGKEYYKIRLSVSSLKAILCESGQKCSIGGVVSINLAGSQQPEIRHKGPLHIYIYICFLIIYHICRGVLKGPILTHF